MGDWKIIVPEEVSNIYDNPSFEEGTTGWTIAGSGATATRETTYSKWGAYSVKIDVAAANCQYYDSITVTAVSHTLSFFARNAAGTEPAGLTAWFNNASQTPDASTELGNGWWYYTYTGTPTAGSRQFGVQIGANQADVWVDGFQLEALGYATTYCDGDQDGCEWNGEEHASTSMRSAAWRGGGREYDLKDDYGFAITRATGVGAAPIQLSRQPYATVSGSRLTGVQRPERVFTLTGNIIPNDSTTTQSRRDDLSRILAPDAYPRHNGKAQPVRIRYEGAATIKEIAAHYEGGLEADWSNQEEYNYESLSLRFFCEDPFWYEIGESAKELDANDAVSSSYMRKRIDGVWASIGTFNQQIIALAEDSQYVYIGGQFSSNAGDGNQSYITRWDKEAEAFSAMSTGLNARVWDIAVGADGTVYIAGEFTAAGGDGQADYFCTWDGSAFGHLGDPDSGGAAITRIEAIAIAENGDIYIGGSFTAFAGTGANHACFYDVSAGAWTALSSNPSTSVYAACLAENGKIYYGGNFTNWVDADGDYIAEVDGTTVASIAAGLTDYVQVLEAAGGDRLFIGGNFTNVGDSNGDYIVLWNGAAVESLGLGLGGGRPYAMARAEDGTLYVSGAFTSAGGSTSMAYLARWTGESWAHVDIDVSSAVVRAFLVSSQDPVLDFVHDLYIGQTTATTGTAPGQSSVVNEGNAAAYPVLSVERSGGTEAVLFSLANWTRGVELLFDYSLLDGEKLTIDLRPRRRDIQSSLFGRVWRASLQGNDIGNFYLQRGTNDIGFLVDQDGGTLTSLMTWKDTFDGFDG